MLCTDFVRIRELDPRDINAILARNLVGRLAFHRDELIDIVPLHYVYADRTIYGRTTTGGKLSGIDPDGTAVAFEVDEVISMTQWCSVLIHGTLQVFPADAEERQNAITAVRRLDRLARRDDPMPDRNQLFRITVDNLIGRAMG